jgi:cysteine desulfurase / selenocysteine lyase
MIYLDHAATSWPKPPEVLEAMTAFLARAGGNPGRSGHRLSIEAGRIVYETRELIARLFHAPDPLRVVLTPNVTYALNLTMLGLLDPTTDRVVTTGVEHNSVMRPLRALQARGLNLEIVPCDRQGQLDLDALEAVLRPGARLVVASHASNVMGTLLPVGEIATLAHAAGALLLVDAAQTAGVLPIDAPALGIDLLAFTGHKGLLGPPGTGGLVIAPEVDVSQIRPTLMGGTGSRSEEERQPEMLPDRLESGTGNGPGIAGLGAGVRHLLARGIEAVRAHELMLTRRLLEGLREVPGVTLYGPLDVARRTATVSLRIDGLSVSEVGWRLDEEHGILSRVGLHCAPAAHRTLGTFPEGTVRLAAGLSNTLEDMDAAIAAVRAIAEG